MKGDHLRGSASSPFYNQSLATSKIVEGEAIGGRNLEDESLGGWIREDFDLEERLSHRLLFHRGLDAEIVHQGIQEKSFALGSLLYQASEFIGGYVTMNGVQIHGIGRRETPS